MNMEVNKKSIVIIGAGIAGLEAAAHLTELGYVVYVIEKENVSGGHVKQWFKTFPYFDDSEKIITFTSRNVDQMNLLTETQVTMAQPEENGFKIFTDKNRQLHADAVLIASGFQLFDAHRKEEYGYGIFRNVITNQDMEDILRHGFPPSVNTEKLRFGFIHCVGSRDSKTGNLYCSKVCCATAVKQAIEIRQFFPDSEVFCFYMDLRMFGKDYEELFHMAQEKYGIHFIRARLSEVNETFEKKLIIKVEDTLTSRPMKLTLDYIVLMSGMEAGADSENLAAQFALKLDHNGFPEPENSLLSDNITKTKGIYLAGAVTGPKTITETLNDARAAAIEIHQYLSKQP
jgi:heterodisulfide reductase subunit A2